MKSIFQAPPTSTATSASLFLFLLFATGIAGILSVEWLCEASHWLLVLVKHPGVGVLLFALAVLERLGSVLYSCYFCSSSTSETDSREAARVPAIATKTKARATLLLLFSLAGTLGVVWTGEAFHWLKLLAESPGVGIILFALAVFERLGSYLYSYYYYSSSSSTSNGSSDDYRDPAAPTVVSGVELFSVEQIKRFSPHCCNSPHQDEVSGAPCNHFDQLRSFLSDFLAKPHKELGRRGTVCPFVPLALKKDSVLMGMAPSSDTLTTQTIEQLVLALQSHFQHKMEPLGDDSNAIFKAIVLGFPNMRDEDAPSLVDHVQQKLKRAFTASGMMLGEFHKLNRTSGLHNPDCYPLQTPFPALAMRFMVPTDLVFLKHDRHYLSAYLQSIPATPANEKYIAEAKRALGELSMV